MMQLICAANVQNDWYCLRLMLQTMFWCHIFLVISLFRKSNPVACSWIVSMRRGSQDDKGDEISLVEQSAGKSSITMLITLPWAWLHFHLLLCRSEKHCSISRPCWSSIESWTPGDNELCHTLCLKLFKCMYTSHGHVFTELIVLFTDIGLPHNQNEHQLDGAGEQQSALASTTIAPPGPHVPNICDLKRKTSHHAKRIAGFPFVVLIAATFAWSW